MDSEIGGPRGDRTATATAPRCLVDRCTHVMRAHYGVCSQVNAYPRSVSTRGQNERDGMPVSDAHARPPARAGVPPGRDGRAPTGTGGTPRPTAYYAEHGAVPRRRRLRLGPRGAARGRRAPARRPRRPGGCSRSAPARASARAGSPPSGAPVVATDLSAGMLASGARGQRQRRRPDRPRVPLVQCDGAALPFADASFDSVFTATARCRSSRTPAASCRGRPGAAPRRPVRLLDDPPDPLGASPTTRAPAG